MESSYVRIRISQALLVGTLCIAPLVSFAQTMVGGSGAMLRSQCILQQPHTHVGYSVTLFEGYTGHLAPTDSKVELRLMRDSSATLDWDSTAENQAHYTGTYTIDGSSRIVMLEKAPGSDDPNAPRTLQLTINSGGGAVTGRYSADNSAVSHSIAGLTPADLKVLVNDSQKPWPTRVVKTTHKKKATRKVASAKHHHHTKAVVVYVPGAPTVVHTHVVHPKRIVR